MHVLWHLPERCAIASMDHLFRLDVQRDASAQSLRAATALALVCAHGYFIVRTSRSALLRFVLAAPMFMTLLYVPMMFRPVSFGLGAQYKLL